MTTRFQPKTVPTGRITPSALGTTTAATITTNSTLSPVSPSAYVSGETDQIYLGKIKYTSDQ